MIQLKVGIEEGRTARCPGPEGLPRIVRVFAMARTTSSFLSARQCDVNPSPGLIGWERGFLAALRSAGCNESLVEGVFTERIEFIFAG